MPTNKFFKNFWKNFANFILSNKVMLLAIIGLITAFMSYRASKLELSYELVKILPVTDQNYQLYESFKERYGEDGNVMVIAIKDPNFYSLSNFNHWYDLSHKLKGLQGVKNIMSEPNLFQLIRNDSLSKFDFKPLIASKPTTQAHLDTIKNNIEELPFYKGLVYNGDAHLMAITFAQEDLNSNRRITLSQEIEKEANITAERMGVDAHFSGMPFIRTNFMSKVSKELIMFMVLAFLVTTFILYLFFRSFRVVFFAIIVVFIAVLFSVGLIQLFGYKITILTGLIPPLIMIIGVPNSIFIINKYQEEYVKSKNQLQALKLAIEKIGKTTFIANLTTFIGFIVFYFTGSPLLLEFGLVAALSVMATWAISLILIPIIFSYNSPPKEKHVRHLENKNITAFLKKVDYIVHNKRTLLYWVTSAILLVSIYGISLIKANGYVVDDLPEDDPIFEDLKFIEKSFNGIVPFEVSLDTKVTNGVFQPEMLNKIRLVQKEFAKHSEFTNPISVVEALKFIYQAYRGGDKKYYRLPGALELNKLSAYTGNVKGNSNLLNGFLDSTNRYTRISFQSADVGSERMGQLYDTLQAKVDTIFNYDKDMGEWLPIKEQYEAKLTGNGVVFTKGNDYLLTNLRDSTLLAILLVSLVMATQFLNIRTILISTIPSILPLLITAGIMGYFAIPLKPSTILIFSIAFGIASDGTIYFLTKYKDEFQSGKSITEAVSETIKFTGISMFYTAFILFFGFGIFVASGFKGTVFLGLLISITLLIGMISNLILLPAFLMTLDKRHKKKLAKS